jgi:hypothetical protein
MLSAVNMPMVHATAIHLMQSSRLHRITLSGEVDGTWSIQAGPPDRGEAQTLTGSGTVQPLGSVGATGTLRLPGFIASGRATGTLTLANAQGSVTLQLTGPLQRGPSVPPRQFSYKITGATGLYAGDKGSGTASLLEVVADAQPVPGPGAGGLPIIVGPIFTLTLH